jgi:hypothetical protein
LSGSIDIYLSREPSDAPCKRAAVADDGDAAYRCRRMVRRT